MPVLRALLVVAFALHAGAAQAAAAWRAPVDGPVLRRFLIDGASPYVAGQHRGVDLRAAQGTLVRAACGGVVRFAGTVGAAGRTVTVACADHLATYLHLGAVLVRAGAHVRAGDGLGTVGRSGAVTGPTHLHLGARRRSDGHYVDPLALIRHGLPAPPALGPAPRAGRRAPRRPVPRPVRVTPRARPAPVAETGAPPVPWAALVGLGLLVAAAAPAGVVGARSSRGRSRAAVASERRA